MSKYQQTMNDLKAAALGTAPPFRFPQPGNNSRITGDMADNMMWIELKFKKYTQLRGNVWESGGFAGDVTKGPTLMFIAPTEMQETFTHDWVDASNVAGRALTAYTGFKKTYSDAKSLGKSLMHEGAGILERLSPGADSGSDASKEALALTDKKEDEFTRKSLSTVSRLANEYRKESFYKYDSPQMYKDSPKPVYNFMFSLGDTGDNEYDILLPIQMLRYLSSASKPTIGEEYEKDLIKIEFPYICEVNTVWGNKAVPIINMKYAAITSLQIQYNGPYRNGIPTKADITLSLSSLMPLYRSTIAGSGTTVSNQNIISISTRD